MNAYNMRDAGAVMHSHSQNVVLASMIMGSEFKCSHIEMINTIIIRVSFYWAYTLHRFVIGLPQELNSLSC